MYRCFVDKKLWFSPCLGTIPIVPALYFYLKMKFKSKSIVVLYIYKKKRNLSSYKAGCPFYYNCKIVIVAVSLYTDVWWIKSCGLRLVRTP